MMLMFGVQGVLRHEVAPDGKTVTVFFQSEGDEIRVVFKTDDLAGLIPILANAHARALEIAGGEGERLQARIPKSFTAGAVAEQPGFVLAVFDKGAPSQVPYILTSPHARDMARALKKAAQTSETLAQQKRMAQPPVRENARDRTGKPEWPDCPHCGVKVHPEGNLLVCKACGPVGSITQAVPATMTD